MITTAYTLKATLSTCITLSSMKCWILPEGQQVMEGFDGG
jgi:hypothetical protein